MSSFMETEESSHKARCTYAITQNQAFHQPIYVCRTCSPRTNNVCCCAGCAETCHKDHEVDIIAFGEAYCDCGASNCLLHQATASCHLFCRLSSLANTKLKQKQPKSLFSSCQIDNIDYSTAITEALCVSQQSKETFWIDPNSAPTCYLESLALSIGQFHLSSLLQDEDEANQQELFQHSGFEWWLQVKPLTYPESNDNYGVDLHYDKDEDMAATWNIGLFPTISTVTYLSLSQTYCHPTIILDCTAANPVESPIQNCFVSSPQLGKHISFTGDLLHGAPQQLLSLAQKNLPTTADSGGFDKRITFLVNVWVGHRPFAVKPLPTEINPTRFPVSNRTSSLSQANVSFSSEKLPVLTISMTDDLLTINDNDSNSNEGEWVTIPFVSTKTQWGCDDDEAGLELTMLLPSAHLALSEYHAQTVQAAQQKKAIQNQTKVKKSAAKVSKKQSSSSAQEAEAQEQEQVDYSLVSSYHLQYMDENVAARLQYELNEDELEDQFMTMG